MIAFCFFYVFSRFSSPHIQSLFCLLPFHSAALIALLLSSLSLFFFFFFFLSLRRWLSHRRPRSRGRRRRRCLRHQRHPKRW